jgi:hypothetical protein
VAPRRRRQVLAGLAGLIGSGRGVYVADVGITNATTSFVIFLVVAPLIVAILSAGWFDVTTRWSKKSRFNLVAAGGMAAVLTCASFVLLYSLLSSSVLGGPWFQVFLIYLIAALSIFWPELIIGGSLVGWVAGTKRFVL